jgi:trehalose 6-phosphate phosphatase
MKPSEELIASLKTISTSGYLLLCCDFDGTLSEIVPCPEDAVLLPGMRSLLLSLAQHPNTSVSIVSGRSLADLKAITQLADPVFLIGSHGAELEFGISHPLSPDQKALLYFLQLTLELIVRRIDGVHIECKPYSIAVHVRRASSIDAQHVLRAVKEGPGVWPGVICLDGKELVELSVHRADKGQAITLLRTHVGDRHKVIYIGDDKTDEYAFATLRSHDIGIKVGAGSSVAEFRVGCPQSVLSLLTILKQARLKEAPLT